MASTSDSDFELLSVDDRLIAPESGFEILDGKLVAVPPCDPPHGERQVQLDALLAVHVADEFVAAADMLTRTSRLNDFAPDASVYPRATDPATGRRQLEHVAFEILSSQTAGEAAHKARELTKRGVRRVFAIDIEHDRCLEWQRELDGWGILDSADAIVDRVFAVPLPVASLLENASVVDAMARALVAKRHAAFDAAYQDGHLDGRRESIVTILAAHDLVPTADELDLLHAESDLARLDRWLRTAATVATVAELLATA